MKNKTTNEPVYPLLISEDKVGFETSLKRFLSTVKESIAGIKPLYESINLEENFDDNTWKLLCQGSNILNERYAKKVKVVSDLIGVTAGLTIESIIKKNHPAISDITNRIFNLRQQLIMLQQDSNAKLLAEYVINVNTVPELSENAYSNHLESHRCYVSNAREAVIRQSLNKFAAEYKEFAYVLKMVGYGPHIGSIHNTYLNNFFTEPEPGILITNPTAWGFLEKFQK